jgi:hypothetical protein
MFIFQYLFDAAQMGHDGLGSIPNASNTLAYAQQSAHNLTISVEDENFYFLPACYHHTILFDAAWTTIEAHGIPLMLALQNFMNGATTLRVVDDCQTPDCNPTCPPGLFKKTEIK